MRGAILLAVVLILTSAGHINQGSSSQSEIESRVRSLVEMRFHAAQAKSVSEISRLYLDDVDLLVFREGQTIRGWAAYEQYWQSALKDLPPSFQLHFQDVDLHAT